MSRHVRFILMLVFSLTLAMQCYAGVKGAVITRVKDKSPVALSQLMRDVEASDLVMIGEAHDNLKHHQMQIALIRSLTAKKIPFAIGLEMFQADSQQQLDDWTEGKITEQNFKEIFDHNWSQDWKMYRDIFLYARDNRIPMVGLNIPKETVMKVSREGYDSLTPAEKKGLPQGTNCDLNNPHTVFLKKSFKNVFDHVTNGKVFTYFCEAQTIRNSGMAMNIARYMKKHPGRKIVGLAGVWHSVRNAVPEQLEQNGIKLDCTVIIPAIPELNAGNATTGEADYVISL